MRELAELTNSNEPAWPAMRDWIAAADVPVTVLPRDAEASARCLLRLQVTTGSVLGALAWECGGILVDHGWVRLLGGGPRLPDLATASGLAHPSAASASPPWLTVGYDVVGGRFAVNGGGLTGLPGEVCYFGPDTLDWLQLGMGHAGFVAWCLTGGGLQDFYAELRWPGWQRDSEGLSVDHGLSVWPPPFTREARADMAATSRRPVPFAELLGFQEHLAEQVRHLPDGATFRIEIDPFGV